MYFLDQKIVIDVAVYDLRADLISYLLYFRLSVVYDKYSVLSNFQFTIFS